MAVPEQRFNEAEVAAIIQRATNWNEPRRQPVPPGEGLSLDQLQEIGRDIGIAPNVIAGAADVVKDSGTTVIRRFLGLPLRVERNVKLRRDFSEDEWDQVVADLREIFNAAGVLNEDGSLRQWSNGNLQVVLEVERDHPAHSTPHVQRKCAGAARRGLGHLWRGQCRARGDVFEQCGNRQAIGDRTRVYDRRRCHDRRRDGAQPRSLGTASARADVGGRGACHRARPIPATSNDESVSSTRIVDRSLSTSEAIRSAPTASAPRMRVNGPAAGLVSWTCSRNHR